MLRAVQGVYHNGVVIPREKVPYHGAIDVVIVSVGDIEGEKNKGAQAYEKLRARIAEKHPELLKETDGEAEEAFEKLSQKVADTMPYKTIEEFERAMRGDEYGLIALHKTSSSKCKGSSLPCTPYPPFTARMVQGAPPNRERNSVEFTAKRSLEQKAF